MNYADMTQDKDRAAFEAQIELPPLVGTLGMLPDHQKTVIEAYGRACARTAIEADRKRQGEVVVTKTPEGEIIAVTRQDDEGKILSVIAEADRKRRGVPVAWIRKNGFRFISEIEPQDDSEVPLYATPQPAEPVACFKCGHSKHGGECVNVAPQPAELATQACNLQPTKLVTISEIIPSDYSEPVKVPSDEDIIQLFVDMVQKDEIGGPVMDISMKEAIEVSRELLRRYGNTANPRPTDDELLGQALRERDAASEMADKLADAIAKHLGVEIGEHSSANHPWYRALDAIEASQPVEPVKVPSDAEIREVLIENGFTIKPGHDDLKPYVYKAARDLLARYGAQP